MRKPPDRSTILTQARAAVRLGFTAAPVASAMLLVLAVLEGLLPVVSAWSLKLLLDEIARGAGASATRVAGAAVALATTGLLLGFRESYDGFLVATVRRRMRLAVQDRLFRRANAFVGLTPFEDPTFLNRLRLAESSGQQAPEELTGALLSIVRSTLMAVGFAVALFAIWPPIVMLLLIAAVPSVALQTRLGRQRARLFEGLTPLMRRQIFFQMLLTDARAAKEVRLFGLGAFLHGRMMRDLRSAQSAEAALDRRVVRTQLALELIAALVLVCGTLVAAYEALHGRLTVGEVSLFLAGVVAVHSAINATAVALATAYEGLLLFSHYTDLVEQPPDEASGAAAVDLHAGIEIDDVWFRYGDGPWVLQGVTLSIPYGSTVGLVGLNGAGKTTLVKLLCRMYEPARGVIRWDGVDIRRLEPESLRERIGAVFQDFMTYDLSAGENVGLGRLAAIDDRPAIRAAAAAAGIDEAIMALPDGYDTLLSAVFEADEEGARALLSGGQWQRVAIARAFLRHDADLMILDEPTAGLDAEAEAEVHRSLHRLRHGRTSLLVSHRLSTLRDADVIYVIDGGRITERGTHLELMQATNGRYARLFSLQAAGYHDVAEPAPIAE
jgi:ATP-binding cassette subfamily B protein